MLGFYTAENVQKNPDDFGRKANRWLQSIKRLKERVRQLTSRSSGKSIYQIIVQFERVSAWLVELLPFCQAQYQVASLSPWMDNEASSEYSLETVAESANPCPGVEETGYLS